MSTQRLHPNLAAVDMVTAPEINEVMSNRFDSYLRDRFRGIKWMRLPVMSGKVSGGAITLGISSGNVCGPDSGFLWSVKRLIVSGLTSGATPDIVNLYLNDNFSQSPLWQFNGNNFGYTFGKMELALMGGDTLSLQNVNTLTATGNITLTGELIEVPAEMMGKLV